MPSCNNFVTAQYRDQDELDVALRQGGLALDVLSNAATPLNVDIGFRHTSCARALSVTGDPARVARGSREVSRDDGGFLGVLLQRMGRTLWSQRGQQQVIGPSEIIVWHGKQSLDLECRNDSVSLACSYLSNGSRACWRIQNSMSELISRQAQI
jgi:hypothetical protein